MRQALGKQSWRSRNIKITAVSSSQQAGRIREMVERRAYRIFESRQGRPGDQLKDWQRAESEVVGPMACGFLTLDNKILLNTDASAFDEGPIEVCAEPRRLTICGSVRADKKEAEPGQHGSESKQDFVFRVLDLPVEIDPLNVTARFLGGRILEIGLARAQRRALSTTNVAA